MPLSISPLITECPCGVTELLTTLRGTSVRYIKQFGTFLIKLSTSGSRTTKLLHLPVCISPASAKPEMTDLQRTSQSMWSHSRVLGAARCMQEQGSGGTEVAQSFCSLFFEFQYTHTLSFAPHGVKGEEFFSQRTQVQRLSVLLHFSITLGRRSLQSRGSLGQGIFLSDIPPHPLAPPQHTVLPSLISLCLLGLGLSAYIWQDF